MNFDKESKSEEIFFYLFIYFFFAGRGGGGGGGGEGEREEGRGWRGIPTEKKKTQKTIGIRQFFVLMLYITFQVPGSSGSLVLTLTKGVTDR